MESFLTSTAVTPTVTKLISLTTPFKQPPGCDSNFAKTSVLPTGLSTSAVPVLLSTAEPSCYPSGWEDVIRTSRFDFYPAVCPSDWTYYSMRETDGELSVALCCNSGYTPLDDKERTLVRSEPYSTKSCGRWVQNTDVEATPSNTGSSRTLMLHEPWMVYWNKSDTSTLTPQLPTLTSDMLVPTWTPGEDIPDGKWDRTPPDDGPISQGGGEFLVIGLPIIGVFLFVVGVIVCVRRCRHQRRRAANEERRNHPSGGQPHRPRSTGLIRKAFPA